MALSVNLMNGMSLATKCIMGAYQRDRGDTMSAILYIRGVVSRIEDKQQGRLFHFIKVSGCMHSADFK